MSRKLMLGLWVSVWPAMALLAPFIMAQVPRTGELAVANLKVDASADLTTIPGSQSSPTVPDTIETRPETPPHPADSSPAQSGEGSTDASQTGQRINRRDPQTIRDQSDASAFEHSEQLPSNRNTSNVRPQRSGSRPNAIRKTSTELTAQEEQAQKLIHERAVLRAQQRHSRLETRQWEKLGRRVPARPLGARTRPHHANTLADAKSSVSPR